MPQYSEDSSREIEARLVEPNMTKNVPSTVRGKPCELGIVDAGEGVSLGKTPDIVHFGGGSAGPCQSMTDPREKTNEVMSREVNDIVRGSDTQTESAHLGGIEDGHDDPFGAT